MSCGHVGCCESSPGRHATAHARSTGHPVGQSFEAGEEWAYCSPDDAFGMGHRGAICYLGELPPIVVARGSGLPNAAQ